MSGKTGTPLGGRELSPARRRRRDRARRAEERRWAERSGPVTTRQVDPASLKGTK